MAETETGEFQKSVEYHQKILRTDPNHILAHLHFAVSLLWAGRPAAARDAVEQTRLKFPNKSFATGLEAQLAALDGDFAVPLRRPDVRRLCLAVSLRRTAIPGQETC